MKEVEMPENNELLPESGNEKLEKSELKSLEKKRGSEASKAEIEKGEKDLAKRGEAAERKLSAEKEKREADLSAEKGNQEKAENKSPQSRTKRVYTKKESKQAFKREIKNVQKQLPRASRAFSKVVHNTAVEKTSNAVGKTIFRPSALLGGSIIGLLAGATVYIVARYYGYGMPSWMLPSLLIAGTLLGLFAEFILTRFSHSE